MVLGVPAGIVKLLVQYFAWRKVGKTLDGIWFVFIMNDQIQIQGSPMPSAGLNGIKPL